MSQQNNNAIEKYHPLGINLDYITYKKWFMDAKPTVVNDVLQLSNKEFVPMMRKFDKDNDPQVLKDVFELVKSAIKTTSYTLAFCEVFWLYYYRSSRMKKSIPTKLPTPHILYIKKSMIPIDNHLYTPL